MFNARFLVVSLGNPAPYHETIHSAGHVALIAAQHKLRATQPAFTSLRFGKKSTQTSLGPKYTFIQSPTEMNVTGPWLSKAYRDILKNENLSPSEMGLVLVHDDLELDFGTVKVRKWDQSHKGHNGVKSVAASLRPPGKLRCAFPATTVFTDVSHSQHWMCSLVTDIDRGWQTDKERRRYRV
jgi:PTH1 family peptidyl-tRNA hydrolase